MGTTAFVGRRYQGQVEGFSMSGNGHYAGVGADVIQKYKGLTNEELTDFLVNRVSYLDYESASEDEQLRIEDELIDNMYEIWHLDWKKDDMEIENSHSLTGEGILSREYGYLFDLDNDTVEVYNQGDYDDNGDLVDGPHKLILVITRKNADKVEKLFLNEPELYAYYNEDDNFIQLFMETDETLVDEVISKAYKAFEDKYKR